MSGDIEKAEANGSHKKRGENKRGQIGYLRLEIIAVYLIFD